MNRIRVTLFMAGLALLLGLMVRQGTAEIAAALETVGWGLLWVSLFHALPLAANTLAWRFVVPARNPPPFRRLLWLRWVGESVNNLLPVGQVGGELLRARLLARQGIRGPLAVASVVVDFTLGILTQAAFALLGVALLVTEMGLNQQSGAIVAGLLLAMLPLLLFLVLQQRGLFALGATVAEKLARGGRWRAFAGDARRVDRGVRGLYARRQPVTRCTITRTLSWIVGTGETWLTLHLLGVPATVADALILESLGYAVRSAAFAVPGALGVQEGGFMVLGALLGLSPTDALVLSLVKRVREVLLGVPGLASWAVYEVRQR